MSIFRIALVLVALTGSMAADAAAEKARKLTTVGTYPPFNGQTVYTVTKGDAALTIEKLYLPDGVTLKVAPDVSSIEWDVKEIVFGSDVTIDLSRDSIPPKAGPGAPPPPQPGYCKHPVLPGAQGGTGQQGANGVSLSLRGVQRIRNEGSLWIKTDGGVGGEGGTGGEGQQGGGPSKRFGRKCDGVPGANGGAGGPGGLGGSTSKIVIKASTRPANRLVSGCSDTCNPPSSARPDGAKGNTGTIAVFGSPGCGGVGGGGGQGGLHGQDPGRSAPGPQGVNGRAGYCTPVDLWQWVAFTPKPASKK